VNEPHNLDTAIAAFGAATKAKLANRAASGAPEDQLRAPLEDLVKAVALLSGIAKVSLVGETTLADLSTRPDYAVTVWNALTGFMEIKAPGKGADPRRFTDDHDKKQWAKLKTLPNLIYTDANSFSLWQWTTAGHDRSSRRRRGSFRCESQGSAGAFESLLELFAVEAPAAEKRQEAGGDQREALPASPRRSDRGVEAQ